MTSPGTRRSRGLVVLLTTLTLGAALVGPSEAAPRRWSMVAVSHDGHHWQRNLTGPLFDSRMVWVPGDTATRSFYVKNRGEGQARLSVRLAMDDRDTLVRAGDLRFFVKTRQRWVRIARPRGRWMFNVRLRPGGVKRVWVRVRLHPQAGNSTMRRQQPFNLRVRLRSTRH